MEREDVFLGALSQVKTFKQSGGKLDMWNANGETTLVFAPARQYGL